MNISGYEIKPIVLTIPDTKEWVARDEKGLKYFAEQGITDIETIKGIHAHRFGLRGTHIYLYDGRANEQFYIGDAKVGCFLSMYLVYSVMNVLPYKHFMFLETDCRFEDGWMKRFEQAMLDVPSDFDFLFASSCCAEDKRPVHIKGEIYHHPFRPESPSEMPQCGHFLVIAKKCLPFLIDTQRDTASPIDISLIEHAFPKLNIYSILPRLADQGSTELPR